MACMQHDCRDCGNQWFDNNPNAVCARCTSTNVAHSFDEDDDYDDDDDDVDDDYGEDEDEDEDEDTDIWGED